MRKLAKPLKLKAAPSLRHRGQGRGAAEGREVEGGFGTEGRETRSVAEVEA
jgi:hypothetical protein